MNFILSRIQFVEKLKKILIIQNANIHFAKYIEHVYNIKSVDEEEENDDISKKFKKKFEFADYLIEITVIKNYLKKLYKRKLDELERFKKQLNYLKKDIYLLETILENNEEDFFCFLNKLNKIIVKNINTELDDNNYNFYNDNENQISLNSKDNNKKKDKNIKDDNKKRTKYKLKYEETDDGIDNIINNVYKKVKLKHSNTEEDGNFTGNINL
ncbi:hypothetical protein H8356DRAFT_1085425 [Neocallimastix lanati (nom. inval.)]|nr:hypothetical protein H8356DRAFT_1085425 [Neocallimastix sp. JGI-2020a]